MGVARAWQRRVASAGLLAAIWLGAASQAAAAPLPPDAEVPAPASTPSDAQEPPADTPDPAGDADPVDGDAPALQDADTGKKGKKSKGDKDKAKGRDGDGEGDSKGGKSKGANVEVGGLLQLRYSDGPFWRGGDGGEEGETAVDGPACDPVWPSCKEWRHSFQVRRARIDLGMKVAGWKVRTKFGFDFGAPRLFNAFGSRKLGGGVALTLGQFKRVFSQAYLTSADEQQIHERPDVADLAGAGRDIGAMLSGDWLDERLMAAVGVWNGNGSNQRLNDNPNLRVEARLDTAPLGAYDLRSHPIGKDVRVRLGAAAAVYRDNERRKEAGVLLTEFDQTVAFSGFAAVKGFGVELRAEAYRGAGEPVDARKLPTTPLPVAASTWSGGFGQVAVDVPGVPALQVAGVIEQWQTDAVGQLAERKTWTAAVNWYWKGDRAKVQAALQSLEVDDADATNAHRWLGFLQMQLMY